MNGEVILLHHRRIVDAFTHASVQNEFMSSRREMALGKLAEALRYGQIACIEPVLDDIRADEPVTAFGVCVDLLKTIENPQESPILAYAEEMLHIDGLEDGEKQVFSDEHREVLQAFKDGSGPEYMSAADEAAHKRVDAIITATYSMSPQLAIQYMNVHQDHIKSASALKRLRVAIDMSVADYAKELEMSEGVFKAAYFLSTNGHLTSFGAELHKKERERMYALVRQNER